MDDTNLDTHEKFYAAKNTIRNSIDAGYVPGYETRDVNKTARYWENDEEILPDIMRALIKQLGIDNSKAAQRLNGILKIQSTERDLLKKKLGAAYTDDYDWQMLGGIMNAAAAMSLWNGHWNKCIGVNYGVRSGRSYSRQGHEQYDASLPVQEAEYLDLEGGTHYIPLIFASQETKGQKNAAYIKRIKNLERQLREARENYYKFTQPLTIKRAAERRAVQAVVGRVD